MKRALFFVFVIVLAIGCQKEESLNTLMAEAIRSELVALPVPSKEEIKAKLSGEKIKSAEIDEPVLALVLQLDGQTYDVYSDFAVKYLVYYEIGHDGSRKKTLTIIQRFPIVDGQVMTDQYNMEARVGYLFFKEYYLEDQNNIEGLIYHFRQDDGQQVSFLADWNGKVVLPPIGKGKWQIEVIYGGEMTQRFHTGLINYFADTNVLTLQIDFYGQGNVESTLNIDKSLIKSAYVITLRGENSDGEERFISFPVLWDENLPDRIIFYCHFDVEYFFICGQNGCQYYNTADAQSIFSPVTGTKQYFY